MSGQPGSRAQLIRRLDHQMEFLKERLRKNHEDGMALVREITRLDHARRAYLEGTGGHEVRHPRPVLIVADRVA